MSIPSVSACSCCYQMIKSLQDGPNATAQEFNSHCLFWTSQPLKLSSNSPHLWSTVYPSTYKNTLGLIGAQASSMHSMLLQQIFSVSA